MHIVYFFVSWWLKHLGLVWYTAYSVWNNDLERAFIMGYAYATYNSIFPCATLCAIVYHVIIFVTFVLLYMFDFKKNILAVASCILAIIPNRNNPYNSLYIKLPIYCFVVSRMKSAKLSSNILFAWILFTHEICLIFIPFQIVYDTYYNKAPITV